MFKSPYPSIRVLKTFNSYDKYIFEEILLNSNMTELELDKCLIYLTEKKYIEISLRYVENNNYIMNLEPQLIYEITQLGIEHLKSLKYKKLWLIFISVLIPLIVGFIPIFLKS